MKAHNDRNVYVLGAGFSAEAGMPLVSNFLNRTRDAVDWLDDNDRKAEADAIRRVLKTRHEAAAAGYRINIDLDNIEHLFSLASALPGSTDDADIRLAIAATLDYSAQTARPPIGRLRVSEAHGWPISKRWRDSADRITSATPAGYEDVESSRYDYYAAALSGLSANKLSRERNVVITLNYDLVLEDAFERLGVEFAYEASASSGVNLDKDARNREGDADALRILKLHGSINWAARTDGGVTIHRDYDSLRKMGGTPLLVPPTWLKASHGALSSVWKAAVDAISNATRLVLIGFSIPVTDQHFKYLLSVGLKENSSLRMIRIVDPNAPALATHYRSVFREDQFRYGIVSWAEKRSSGFFYDGEELKGIGRSLAHPGLELVAPDRNSHLMKE